MTIHLETPAIHGNKSQNARERILTGFKLDKVRVLVASDIAARGLDISDVTHVINFDVPPVVDAYVHRIGRTGRAAATGIAMSFCDNDERKYIKDIEKTTGERLDVMDFHPLQKPVA